MTHRESILAALPTTALRDEVLPKRVSAEGLMILRDGEPGEPEVTLSHLRYPYQHRAEIEAVVQGAARDAAFDTLIASVGAALAADRTLGGFCDWVEAESLRPVDLPVEGAASLKAAVNRIATCAPSCGTTVNTNGMPRTAVGTVSTPALVTTNLSTTIRR